MQSRHSSCCGVTKVLRKSHPSWLLAVPTCGTHGDLACFVGRRCSTNHYSRTYSIHSLAHFVSTGWCGWRVSQPPRAQVQYHATPPFINTHSQLRCIFVLLQFPVLRGQDGNACGAGRCGLLQPVFDSASDRSKLVVRACLCARNNGGVGPSHALSEALDRFGVV